MVESDFKEKSGKEETVSWRNEWSQGRSPSLGFYDLVQNAASLCFLNQKMKDLFYIVSNFFSWPSF